MSWVVGDDTPARQGKTVTSKVTFRPGLNSIIVAIARQALPQDNDEWKTRYAAQYFADLMGVPVQYVGKDPMTARGQVYNIGQARPVYIHPLGITDKRLAWYQKLGSPVGSDVVFVALNFEWRGTTQTFEGPVGNVAIPSDPRVIPSQWDDGTVEEQKERLAQEATAKTMSQTSADMKEAYENAKVAAEAGQEALKAFEEWTIGRLIPELMPGAGWKINAALIAAGVVAGVAVLWYLDQKNPFGQSARMSVAKKALAK